MTPDNKRVVESVNPNYLQIEKKLKEREPELGTGIRRYIRSLKQSGQWDEAMRVRKNALESKRLRAADQLELRLTQNLQNIVLSDDEATRALSELDEILILHATGEIDSSERRADVQKVYDTYPEQSELLEQNARRLDQEVAVLVVQSK